MATHRRRFYLAIRYDGARQVLSLKFKPTPELYAFSHKLVSGPYRTFSDACDALSAYLM